MIEERAIVRRVQGGEIHVQALNPGNCPRCAEGRGCGGGILAKLVSRQRPDVRVESRLSDLRVGEMVVVGIDESALLSASVWVYLVPLGAMLLAGAIAQQWLQAPDPIVMAFGIAGLALGLAWLRRQSARAGEQTRFRPVILRREGAGGDHCARMA